MPPKTTLSASRIKTALNCSWKYVQSYVNKIPEPKNRGASIGSTVHVVLECLAHPRREKLARQIIKSGKLFSGKNRQGIKKLVYKLAHQCDVADEESIDKIEQFILNGLQHDFFGEKRGKPVLALTEKDFDFAAEEYKIRGFIDRLFIYKDGHALIRDYKSSKETYKGEEASKSNLQAQSYVLAVKKLSDEKKLPPVKSISVEFLFLKYDCTEESEWATGIYQGKVTKKQYHNGGGCITLEYDLDDPELFEFELAEYQKYVDSLDEKTACSNFAAEQGEPEDGSFGGRLSCGYSKYEGQLKKDGTIMFACPFKYKLNYYYITDAENNFTASCFLHEREKLESKYPPSKFHWEERHYEGCKFWREKSY